MKAMHKLHADEVVIAVLQHFSAIWYNPLSTAYTAEHPVPAPTEAPSIGHSVYHKAGTNCLSEVLLHCYKLPARILNKLKQDI